MSQAPAPTSVPEPGKARWARASNLSLLLGRGLGLESQAVAGHATPVWQPLVLALATLLLLFTRLDTVLLEPDEGRYAELPRLMNLSGDYLTPRLEGKPYNDKPPLVYWLIAAAYGLLGTEAAVARAVMALMASATVAATYAWARVHVGPTPAFLAGLVLLTQFGFAGFGRMLLLDSTLAFFVVSGLLAGHHAVAGPRLRWGWWLVAAVCVGLGGLAKGPVAGVLVLPPLLLYRWLDSTSCRWGWRAGMLFVGCAVALTAPWYAAMFLTNESFFSEHVVRHHVL
ncbi:MAG TPA: glycosyltransferase family 39 protein, partial [Gemmatales bacterium]|nr:glycosyltransferase family 39 protein [Gemmatales bacterium]